MYEKENGVAAVTLSYELRMSFLDFCIFTCAQKMIYRQDGLFAEDTWSGWCPHCVGNQMFFFNYFDLFVSDTIHGCTWITLLTRLG